MKFETRKTIFVIFVVLGLPFEGYIVYNLFVNSDLYWVPVGFLFAIFILAWGAQLHREERMYEIIQEKTEKEES